MACRHRKEYTREDLESRFQDGFESGQMSHMCSSKDSFWIASGLMGLLIGAVMVALLASAGADEEQASMFMPYLDCEGLRIVMDNDLPEEGPRTWSLYMKSTREIAADEFYASGCSPTPEPWRENPEPWVNGR